MAYRYNSLPDSRFRLIVLLPGRSDDVLHVEIVETQFSTTCHDTTPAYEAISYEWGNQGTAVTQSKSINIVQSGGNLPRVMHIGSNLHAALVHLRSETSSRRLWCDFICINQADLAERALQVAQMADIYRRAQKVIVWLGLEADDSGLAMKALRYSGSQVVIDRDTRRWHLVAGADPRYLPEAHGNPYELQELRAIQKLCARPWFKRLWVRQEVTLATSVIVVAGNDEIDWTHLVAAVAFLDTLIRLRGLDDAGFGRDLFNIFEFGCLKSYKGIIDILHACRACECTEESDRVYAVLGLLSSCQPLNILPDYSKRPKDIYRELVMEFYRRYRRLDILVL